MVKVDVPEGFDRLNNDEAILLHRAMLEKWIGFMLKEMDDDVARLDDLDLLDQLVLRARWMKYVNLVMDSYKLMEKYQTQDGKWDLLTQIFGDQLNLPSNSLALDVKQRLNWYKQRAARNFERTVTSDVDVHGITSPIEQIFLMEWRLLEIDHRYRVKIRPQHELTLDGRNVRIDFVVDVSDGRKIAIELDGHDFHERTKEQAAHDRARERTIVRNGFIIQRFAGSEIARNSRKCVQEVVDLISRTDF